MAVYGSYETVAEIGRTRASSVFKARPADGGWDLGFADLGTDTAYAIKAARVRSAQDAGDEETKRFFQRAKDQKRVAAAPGNTHWAPVFEAGEQRGEAYYITQLYPSSVAAMFQSRERVDAATLHAIVTGTLEGLLEISRSLGRPHGNLKAANVLLRRTRRLEACDIVLTDPAADSDATIAGEVEDLYNLGELIHELVLGHRFPGQHIWPLKMSAKWQSLGKTGPAWLELCNRLLSPRAAEQWLRFDDILDEVAALRSPRKKAGPRRSLVLYGMLALLVGLGVGEWFRYRSIWRGLCGSYESWAGPVAARLAANPPTTVTADPYLRENLLGAFNRAAASEVPLDPRKIAGSDRSLEHLAGHPPLSFAAVWKTERANWILRGVEKDLSAANWPALKEVAGKKDRYRDAGWLKLSELAGRLVEDASKPAPQGPQWIDALARLVEGHRALARLDSAREAAVKRLERLDTQASVNLEIRARIELFGTLLRQAIKADAATGTASSVEILARQVEDAALVAGKFEAMLPLLADASRRQRAYEVRQWTGPARHLGAIIESARPAGETELAKIAEQLNAAQDQWTRAENLRARIENRRRILDSSGDRILLTYRQHISASGLAQQPDLVSLVRKLEEINDDPQWEAAAKKVAAPEWGNFDVIAFSQRSEAHRNFVGKTVATEQDLKVWLAEVDGQGAMIASATIKPDVVVQTTRPATAASTHPSPTTLASTQQLETRPAETRPVVATTTRPSPTTVAAATRPAPDPEKIRRETEIANFIIECREIGINAGHADIKQAWRDAGARHADAVMKDPSAFESVKAVRQRLRGRLVQLDGAWRTAATPLKLELPDAPWQQEFARRINEHAAAQLAAQAADLIKRLQSDDAKFEAGLDALVDADEQWRGKAMKLANDVRRISQNLAAGYTPTEKTPEGGTLSSAVSAVRADAIFSVEGVAKALDPVLAPLANVENLKESADLRKAAAEELPLGVRLYAWSKLGSNASRQTLESDIKLGQSLFAAAQSARIEASRLDSIKTTLESDLRLRWLALLESSKEPQDIELAIATRNQIASVDFEKLSPRSRFNLALRDLRAAVAAGGDPDLPKRISPSADKLRQAAAALGAQDGSPMVKALLDAVSTIEKPASLDASALGPMSPAARAALGSKIQWTARVEDNGALIVYQAKADAGHGGEALALSFRRVRTSESALPSFVLTSEVSMGVLDDLVVAAGKWPDIRARKLLPPYDPLRGDPRPGPRTWEWPRFGKSPGIVRPLLWLSSELLPAGADHYPEAIGSEFNRTVIRDSSGQPSQLLNPSRRQPMQYISAQGAQTIASLAGCRIPTAAEWLAARKLAADAAKANLRDRTWRLELEHLQRPPIAGKYRPDAGMFVPAGEKPSDAIWKTDAGAEMDDGVLWFRPVPAESPAQFIDLAGNVAEFVTDSSGKVGVIGASALSPPQRLVDEVFTLSEEQLSSGFSDVGLRLAFSIPAPSMDPLKDAIAGNWYLTGK